MEENKREKVNWNEAADANFRKLGDIVLHGNAIYNYDDDCWRYAPDVYAGYVMEGDVETITEDEARKIVEANGGKNFDNLDEVLYKVDGEGEFSGLD